MDFDVCGPLVLGRFGANKLIFRDALNPLKEELEEYESGLSGACGCYIFALRAAKGYRPWYVGQSCKTSIANEALNSTNREKYNRILSEYTGTPVLFLMPLRTPKGGFRKLKTTDGSLKSVSFLERWLISVAIHKNPDLANNKETMLLRRLHVAGVFNARKGESTKASQELNKALWK